jgi:carbon monoxide dehydrogenase subunit G
MKLEGDYVFEAGIQDVWDALFDPAVLAAVLPGCEKLDLVDGSYIGDIKVKVGPIQGKFSGKVDLLEKIEPRSYKMVVDGRGAQGFVKATATIALEPSGSGTKIVYDSEAQVGGKIASVGQRLVETSARAIVKQSLDGLHDNIKIRAEAYRVHTAVTTPTAKLEPSGPVVLPPAPAPAEPIEYKKADAGKLAATVAKEVTKTMAPVIAIAVVVIAVVIYLLVR